MGARVMPGIKPQTESVFICLCLFNVRRRNSLTLVLSVALLTWEFLEYSKTESYAE